jgi:hypothetical protein
MKRNITFAGMRCLSLILLSAIIVGCDQGNDRLIEKAQIEGREQARSQLDMQNQNLAKKAKKMEEDLSSRHLFYQAVRGTYEGTMKTERGEFNVRLTLIPSLPPYYGDRVRQLEEIASDLNNLYFNAQVVQWNPANNLSAVGCRVENIRPDIIQGEIPIASSNCQNLYQLKIIDEEIERNITVGNEKSNDRELAREVSRSIREGRITEVSEIRGEAQPTTNASVYNLVVRRVTR